MRFGRVGFGEVVDLDADLLQEARVAEARRNHLWVEIEDDLVARGPGWLVSSTTDRIYTPHRGVIWESGTTNLIADQVELYFCVRDGELFLLDRLERTWSQHVAKQARRGRVPA